MSGLCTWLWSLGPTGSAYRSENQVFGPEGVAPTDDLLVSLTLNGMSRRLGTELRPPLAVRAQHVRWNIDHRTRLLADPALLPAMRHDLCLANLVELLFWLSWLSWLRAYEAFSLRWCDIEAISPALTASRGLPPNLGAFLLKLLESTKPHLIHHPEPTKQRRTT